MVQYLQLSIIVCPAWESLNKDLSPIKVKAVNEYFQFAALLPVSLEMDVDVCNSQTEQFPGYAYV